MKCPHCNQDHPEGTKFCPETGERIVNKEVHNAPSSIKSWSTQQDFDRGDIIVDGVILGKTNLSELRKRGCDIDTLDYETGRESNVYSVYLGNGGRIIGLVSRLTYKDLEQKSEGRKNPLAFNKEALLNLYSKVVSFGIKLGDEENLLLQVIGVEDKGGGGDDDDFVFDYSEIADNLEEHGYMRIESFMVKDMGDCVFFIHNESNSNGDYVFITLDPEQEMIFFSVNDVTEWTSYRTGQVYRV